MKSKLLLSLGLGAILGMPQTVEASSDIDVARSILARLSPEQRTALFAEYAPQERGSFVSVNSPRMTPSDADKDPEWLVREFYVRKFEDMKELRIDMSYGSTSPRLNELMDQRVQVLRAISEGRTPNLRKIFICLDKRVNSEEVTKELVNVIKSGKLSALQNLCLYINSSEIRKDQMSELERAIVNSRMPELRRLTLYTTNSSFGYDVAERKIENFPKLSEVISGYVYPVSDQKARLEIARDKGIALIGGVGETAIAGVESTYAPSFLIAPQLYQLAEDWRQRNGQED